MNWKLPGIEEFVNDRQEQDRRPLTEKADPLALSWVSYHIWTKSPQRRWIPWGDLEACQHDHDMAAATRRYYRNRLAMRALKATSEVSQFSRDLYDICNGGIMRECHRGMLYRLPYFYVEDTQMDHLISVTKEQPSVHFKNLPGWLAETSTRQLIRHDRILHSRRSREVMEYWFHDAETGYAVKWPVTYDNPLRSVIDHYFNTVEYPRIHARWSVGHDRIRDFQYWVISQPEIQFA